MSELDDIYPHKDNCGHCECGRIWAEELEKVAPVKMASSEEILAACAKARARWEDTKYFKFAQECQKNGLNWQEEFKKKGWEP